LLTKSFHRLASQRRHADTITLAIATHKSLSIISWCWIYTALTL